MKTYFHLSLILTLSFGLGMTLLLSSASGPQGRDLAEFHRTAAPPGPPDQTATLLPDGRWLLVGGEGQDGPRATAAFWDPHTRATTPVSGTLASPRAWHTATMLPDGTVLVVGGVGADGQVVESVERFEPATQAFVAVPGTALTPRVSHTVTLLTDGRVLLAGGISVTGELLATAEL
jgi:hypothetical protein